MRKAIVDAAGARKREARVHHFVFLIEGIRQDLLGPFEALERTRDDHIEIRKDILGGEPVIKGTRIAARHVADLIKRGATRIEIGDDLDLTDAQIEAALLFDRTRRAWRRPSGDDPDPFPSPRTTEAALQIGADGGRATPCRNT